MKTSHSSRARECQWMNKNKKKINSNKIVTPFPLPKVFLMSIFASRSLFLILNNEDANSFWERLPSWLFNLKARIRYSYKLGLGAKLCREEDQKSSFYDKQSHQQHVNAYHHHISAIHKKPNVVFSEKPKAQALCTCSLFCLFVCLCVCLCVCVCVTALLFSFVPLGDLLHWLANCCCISSNYEVYTFFWKYIVLLFISIGFVP